MAYDCLGVCLRAPFMLAAKQRIPGSFYSGFSSRGSLSCCWHHTAGQVEIFIPNMPTPEGWRAGTEGGHG